MHSFWQDLRFGARMLLKNPVVTLVAVTVLTLGIGANTAIFSVVHAVLLRSLPYTDGERLAVVWEKKQGAKGDQNVINLGNFSDWKEQNNVFTDMAAFFDLNLNLTGDGEPEEIPAQIATTNLFSVLDANVVMGRTFAPGDGADNQFVGKAKLPPGQQLSTGICVTDVNYFQAMQIPLKRGRLFLAPEGTEMRHVTVVNEAFARKLLPGEDPIGKRVVIYMKDENVPTEIVGVVGDNKHMGLDTEVEPMAYWTHPELTYASMTLVIRTHGDAASIAPAAREVIRGLDPDQPVGEMSTMEGLLAKSMSRSRFNTTLLAVLAVVALVMAAVGVYGVMSYSVLQRTHEIGVRMALGAQRLDVIKLVVRQGIILGLVGVLAGLAASFGLTRLIATLLFEVAATDKTTFAVVAVGLFLITLIACCIPARRATKVDPLVALRYE